MATILDVILSEKKVEIENYKKMNNYYVPNNHREFSFISILEKAKEIAIIAEFKRASPSKGEINMDVDAKEQAMDYIQYGADAVSVLTDSRFFKGNFTDLEAVREGINAPILCKDFIIDSLQIDMAKNAGANIILLIVAAMDEDKLIELFQYAKMLGLEVLVEVHNEEELNIALKTGAKIIGVNNRNLKTFEVDLAVTEKLGPLVKKSGAFLISESGMKTVEDVKRVVKAGANGILVGETFMKSDDLLEKFKELKIPIQGQEEK